MGIHAKRGVLASTASLLLCVAVAGPAVAVQADEPTTTVTETPAPEDINTAPPAEPEEEVSDVPDAGNGMPDEPTYTPTPPKDWPDAEYCGPSHGVYTPSTKGKQYHKGVGPTLSNYNGTSRTAKSTFTSEVTGEVGVSVSSGLAVSVDAMIGKIEAKYDVNLSVKLTAKLGNSIAVDTPSKKTTNAKYGVYRLKNTGQSYTLYNTCKTSAKKTITSYTPYRVGWYLWEE
ncbi:hypothetical protein GCM10010358_74000 [Streptomyces minutiscleroticus]|uniref:Uncharacterized protein n=1 Tax=Streptomyces minutiscleroticus TaxID=68238 RepID=A0A918U8M2_9ACTN|nr:hypothetical protein [Streptomyces minutiscleroticus]GGY10691.1 hypothetical protein GCM10010358_74000 [Streptomyces minutiscleroticus]